MSRILNIKGSTKRLNEITNRIKGLSYSELKKVFSENQISYYVQNEVAVAKAEAEKKVAKAEGDAKALKVKADAEAYYNRTVSNSLSTLIIQQNMLEKWDGKLPMMSGSSNVMLDVNKLIK